MADRDSFERIRFTHHLRDCPKDINISLKESRNPDMNAPHLHTEYEVYYSISGGKGFFIDDHYYECNPQDMFIIRKMHVHRVTIAEPDNYVRCVISIDTTVIHKLRALLADPNSLSFLDEAGVLLPVKVHLSKENHDIFLMHIREYLRLEQTDNALLLAAKLFEILSFIKFTFKEQRGVEVLESEPQLWSEKAIYYVERHFKKCQTGDVAAALDINENYLGRVFKSEMGTPLNNYIIQRKIAEAKKLLYNGASVKEACVGSGFNDCSNFIRTFKKFTGISPGTIKKNGSIDISGPRVNRRERGFNKQI